MKRIRTRALSMLLAIVLLLGMIPAVSISTSAAVAGTEIATGSGAGDRWLKADTYYDTKKALEGTPLTFEVVIKHPDGGSRRDSTMSIFSSYVDASTPSVTFGLSGRRPTVTVVNQEGKTVTRKMTSYTADNTCGKTTSDKILIYNNKYMHVAYVIDPTNDTASIYLNGNLAGKYSQDFGTLPKDQLFRLGGDFREGNSAYFDGAIHLAAVYNTPRTAEQIKADYESLNSSNVLDYTDVSLIAAWDLSKQGETGCRDRSGNGFDLTFHAGEGMRFDNYGPHKILENLSDMPETVEAWIYLPSCYSRRGGTILGNFAGSKTEGSYFGFEINYSGAPRFFYTDATTETSYDYKFSSVNLRADAWTHIAWVHDVANGEMRFYVNGVLAETATTAAVAFPEDFLDTYCHVGGDKQQNGQSQRFNAFIKELRVYSDVRTDAELASDYAGTLNYDDSDFILHYDMKPENQYQDLVDLTGNGNTAVYEQSWWDEVNPPSDYAYSFAIVGDTQRLAWKTPAALTGLYQWIADNAEDKKMQYVLGLGDITENNSDEEWTLARDAIKQLDGKVPYSLIWGAYHDSAEKFNEYFGESATDINYTDNVDGYMTSGDISNTYHEFSVGTQQYLILCLETGAQDHILEWAAGVIEAHPEHRVIITTHAYLQADGTFLEAGESSCATSYDSNNNNGDDLWEKLFSKHPNIYMVLCGHMLADKVVVRKSMGDYGNVVTEMLINPQGMDVSGATGMVAMLYFSEDGNDVHVEYYSTAREQWKPNQSFTTADFAVPNAPDLDIYDDIGEEDITEEYKSLTNYPFVAFVDGECKGGAKTWRAIQTVVKGLLDENNGATVYVLLRKNVSSGSAPLDADNVIYMNGTVIFDLGGHTMTTTALLFRGTVPSNYTGDYASNVIIKNGTLNLNGEKYPFYAENKQIEGVNKVLNLTFENVTFNRSSTSNQTFYIKNNNTPTKSNHFNFTFNDCTFDFADTSNDCFLFSLSATKVTSTIRINGGSIIASANSKLTVGKLDSTDSLFFGKGSDGNYTTLTLPEGVTTVTDSLNTDTFKNENGDNVKFVKSGDVYKLVLADLKITGAYLRLNSNINVLYSANVPAEYENPYMVFEFNGKSVTVTDYTVADDGELLFAFEGVAPHMMKDNIKATLYATKNGTPESVEKAEYSVLKYCETLLSMSAAELGMTDSKYAAMQTLIADLVAYGKAAQDYKDYDANGEIAIEGVTPSENLPTESDAMTVTGNTDAPLHFTSATVRFDTVNSIVIKIFADVEDASLVTVRINGVDYKLTDLTDLGNGTYKLSTEGIKATNFDTVYTVELLYNGESVATLGYSVNAYAYAMSNGATQNAEMKVLAETLYRYGASADSYNNAQ